VVDLIGSIMTNNELAVLGIIITTVLTILFGIPSLFVLYCKNKHEKWKPKVTDFVECLDISGSYYISKIDIDNFSLNKTYILRGELMYDTDPIILKKTQISKISKRSARKLCNSVIN
jgi:hypothetical protein